MDLRKFLTYNSNCVKWITNAVLWGEKSKKNFITQPPKPDCLKDKEKPKILWRQGQGLRLTVGELHSCGYLILKWGYYCHMYV